MLITLRAYLSPVCDSLFHGLWTSAGASHGKVLSLSTSLALRRMLQCPHCSKSLSVGLSLVAHLSIEFHWWSFVYLAIVVMFCQTSSFFFSELLTKKKKKTTKKTTSRQTQFQDPPLDPRWISWIATFYLLRHVMMMITIKANYNYHKKISQNPLKQFLIAL